MLTSRQEACMQISELSRQSGVPAKTIRYYEAVGLLPVPARADNNYRHYDQTVLERLLPLHGLRRDHYKPGQCHTLPQ